MLKQGLKQKFVIYLILLVIFISFAFLAFFINRMNVLIKHELIHVGSSLVKSLSYSSELGVASEDVTFFKPYFDKIFKETDVVLVAVYTKDGIPLLVNKKISAENKISIEIMQTIVSKGDVIKISSYTEEGDEFYDFYAPIFFGEESDSEKEFGGFARIGLSMSDIASHVRTMLQLGLSITILLCVLGIFISFFIANRLLKPIKELERGSQAFASGNFDYRIKVKTGDEVEDLADSFNKMAETIGISRNTLEETKKILEVRVQARTEELQELADDLEDKVKERTGELQERVDELERFHKLTVGRELKMVELKEEIKKLKQKRKRS